MNPNPRRNPSTVSWADLFERASIHEVTIEEITERLRESQDQED